MEETNALLLQITVVTVVVVSVGVTIRGSCVVLPHNPICQNPDALFVQLMRLGYPSREVGEGGIRIKEYASKKPHHLHHHPHHHYYHHHLSPWLNRAQPYDQYSFHRTAASSVNRFWLCVYQCRELFVLFLVKLIDWLAG